MISGTSSGGTHHSGVLEGWFGVHWWTGRTFVVSFTTVAVFAPLVSFKRIGECFSVSLFEVKRMTGELLLAVHLLNYKSLKMTGHKLGNNESKITEAL